MEKHLSIFGLYFYFGVQYTYPKMFFCTVEKLQKEKRHSIHTNIYIIYIYAESLYFDRSNVFVLLFVPLQTPKARFD